MTLWTPDWRVQANGNIITNVVLTGLTINSGRTDFNSPTLPGYANLTVINTDNTIYSWTINTSITIEVKDTSGNYVAIFGGRVSDIATEVNSAGSTAVVTLNDLLLKGTVVRKQHKMYP